METMYLIVGRSGSGKDYLARSLIKQSGGTLTQNLTYTTRPKRNALENNHIYITEEDANHIPESAKRLKTEIAGYEYFTTAEDLQNTDIFIIEPNGLAELLSLQVPGKNYVVISVQADETARKYAAEKRGDKKLMGQMFDKRAKAEKDRFDAFENQIASRDGQVQFKTMYPNVKEVFVFNNDFKPFKADNFIRRILGDNAVKFRAGQDDLER